MLLQCVGVVAGVIDSPIYLVDIAFLCDALICMCKVSPLTLICTLASHCSPCHYFRIHAHLHRKSSTPRVYGCQIQTLVTLQPH